MRSLPKPTLRLADFYDACVMTIEDDDRRNALLAIKDELIERENTYDAEGLSSSLYTIAAHAEVNGVPKKSLKDLYSGTFARKNSPTRVLYDSLRSKAPGGICPLCNQRVVGTLDHHLAKGSHPAFSVTPINLVPACTDCNKISSVKDQDSAATQTMHPYYDRADTHLWLTARVEELTPPAVIFSTQDVNDWTDEKNSSVAAHFTAFGLADLYTAQAATELVNVYHDADENGFIDNAEQLRQQFTLLASRRRRSFRNSWQGAFFQALAESEWFISGGIREVTRSPLFGDATV